MEAQGFVWLWYYVSYLFCLISCVTPYCNTDHDICSSAGTLGFVKIAVTFSLSEICEYYPATPSTFHDKWSDRGTFHHRRCLQHGISLDMCPDVRISALLLPAGLPAASDWLNFLDPAFVAAQQLYTAWLDIPHPNNGYFDR